MDDPDASGIHNVDGDDEHSLLFPFICVKSNGGVYEDEAFVAGAQFGQVLNALRNDRCAMFETYVYPEIVATVDLAAMRHGWMIKLNEPWKENPGEWVYLQLIRTSTKTP